jgi:hypothetical protein
MAEKLIILMNDESKRSLFGDLAEQTVEKFEINNVVYQWKKLIEKSLY